PVSPARAGKKFSHRGARRVRRDRRRRHGGGGVRAGAGERRRLRSGRGAGQSRGRLCRRRGRHGGGQKRAAQKSDQGKIMKSMTGYGEASQSVRGVKVTVQIRSLNHRHLDMQLRVPREYLAFEEDIRKAIRERIARGLEMDEALVGQYIAGLKQVQKKYRLGGEVGIAMLTPMTELFHVREVESDPGGERTALLKALGAALKKLERSREREGAQLKADMEGQIEHIGRIALAIEARAAENGARAQKS